MLEWRGATLNFCSEYVVIGKNCSYALEDFFVSDANRSAYTFVSKKMGSGLIVGPKGSGKTHLAHIWQNLYEGAVFYRGESPYEVHATHVICDDAHLMNEGFLFNLYNIVLEKGGAVLCTMESVPQFEIRDLESRMHSLVRMRIFPPGHLQVREILLKVLKDNKINCPPNVLDYAALQIPCSYQAIHVFVLNLLSIVPHFPNLSVPLVKKALASSGL